MPLKVREVIRLLEKSGHISCDPEADWNRGAETITRKYSLVIEGDCSGYSAYVPELPTILVTGASVEELSSRAAKAIRIYWENLLIERSPTSLVREIEVEFAGLTADD